MPIYLDGNNKLPTFALTISRSGAVVARQAHNLEVVGSNPASATEAVEKSVAFFAITLFLSRRFCTFGKSN